MKLIKKLLIAVMVFGLCMSNLQSVQAGETFIRR